MTKEITCFNGEIILVDDEDYPVLSRHKWRYRHSIRNMHYAATQMNVGDEKDWRTIFMHNMILGFAFYVDHIDGNTKNNQKSNLRPATMQENGWNRGKPKRCRHGQTSSQYKGVSKYKNSKGETRWRVMFVLTKKGEKPVRRFNKSGFKSELDAARCYNEEIVKHRKEWAWVNPLPETKTAYL